MRNTPTCFPILTILYLVANSLYFHIKRRKASHFDARTVDSFVLKRDWGSPCWPWMTRMVWNISQKFILSISNCEWHCPVKSAPESENTSTHVWIFSVYPINVQRTYGGKRDPDECTYVDQVSPLLRDNAKQKEQKTSIISIDISHLWQENICPYLMNDPGMKYIQCRYLHYTKYKKSMFVVVNFDALAQASDIQIERRQVASSAECRIWTQGLRH